MNPDAGRAMAGLRVLDLSDLKGALCGRLLADMGAEVIKVEPPQGDPTRRLGPFVDDRPHPDRSVPFWFYNLNKRSVTLDYQHARGAELLGRLAESADVMIESFAPGRLLELGLDFDTLRRRNPALIMCSLAPFGQNGPYRDYEAEDSVLAALSGMIYINGFPDAAPIRPLGLQAYHCAGYFGAIAILGALFARERSGLGQWIDLSIQEASACAIEHVMAEYFGKGRIERRYGMLHWSRTYRVARCADGFVALSFLGDWTTLLEWLKADGKAEDLVEVQWLEDSYRLAHCEHLFEVMERWAAAYPAAELVERAQALRLPFGLVQPLEQLRSDPQLQARGFFVAVEHPELGRSFLYPGAPFHFSATPWRVYRRPPLQGEHNREILAELGITSAELAVLHAEGVC